MIHRVQQLREEGIYESQLDEHEGMPVSLFLPQSYEPRYPYPLLVFLHGHGADERQWLDLVPQLSRRNYIGLGLRGPQSLAQPGADRRFGWGCNRQCSAGVEDYILTAIRETMRGCHVHTERIYLAGICEGASVAYQMGLTFPEKFAGVIALNGWKPEQPLPVRRFQTHSLKVFIGHGNFNRRVPRAAAEETFRLFYAAGQDVELNHYPVDDRLHPAMLRDVNRWLMEHCHPSD